METLINTHKISKSFASEALFSNISFGIKEGEKIGLIGANGVGKSTLIKILAGLESSDTGEVSYRKHVKVAYVPQTPVFNENATIFEYALDVAKKLKIDEFSAQTEVSILLSQAGFEDFDRKVSSLSGGWKKRLAISCSKLGSPDVIFFDEPSNHLDWQAQLWLEDFLNSAKFTWLVISHDRYLLNNLTKKIIEIGPQFESSMLVTYGGYEQHLAARDEYLQGRIHFRESIENKLRREEEWLARGAQARSTKAKYRISAAEDLKNQVSSVKKQQKVNSTDINFQSSGRKTKKLLEFENVSFSYPEKTILKNLNFTLTAPGVFGVLGANGVGKTTLFKLISGQNKETTGNIKQANNLNIVYFDQHRDILDHNKTLKDSLCEHGDHVLYGESSIHVRSWAQKFGFSTDQLQTKLEKLSGGEKARVLIAQLMLKKADILLLDEPTNDLDIDTLEILEDSLRKFPGTVLIISHDRYMMSRICKTYLGFDGQGEVFSLSSIDQWLKILKKANNKSTSNNNKKTTAVISEPVNKKTKKLSYLEQREFDGMEKAIQKEELSLEKMQHESQDESNASSPKKMQELYQKMTKAQENIDSMYARWSELEEKLN